ncbi:MAG TPA: hypothetical protein VH761_08365 [Ilumatobacteraceae bacterium]
MKLISISALAVLGATALLGACGGDDDKTTTPTTISTDVTFPPGVSGVTVPQVTIPSDLTIPPGGTFPPDVTIPQAVIDQMITQFEAAGLKVDQECFENLLNDEELRRLVVAGDTPSAEVIQRLTACFTQ